MVDRPRSGDFNPNRESGLVQSWILLVLYSENLVTILSKLGSEKLGETNGVLTSAVSNWIKCSNLLAFGQRWQYRDDKCILHQ